MSEKSEEFRVFAIPSEFCIRISKKHFEDLTKKLAKSSKFSSKNVSEVKMGVPLYTSRNEVSLVFKFTLEKKKAADEENYACNFLMTG